MLAETAPGKTECMLMPDAHLWDALALSAKASVSVWG